MAKKRKATKSTAAARGSKTARNAIQVAAARGKSAKERIAALRRAPGAVTERNSAALLKVLLDRAEDGKVRLAALQALQASSFNTVAFEPARGDYIAALREVSQDADAEMRQRALGILAREKDGFAQRRLIEGLRNPDKALVPIEKALQLLSYDVHSEAYPIARTIAANPPSNEARREALRLLAADATAAPMFEKILKDRNAHPEARQVSAAALRATRPERLDAAARDVVMDDGEEESIQATCLTALSHFGGTAEAPDAELFRRIEKLSKGGSKVVQQAARQYLQRYGR